MVAIDGYITQTGGYSTKLSGYMNKTDGYPVKVLHESNNFI